MGTPLDILLYAYTWGKNHSKQHRSDGGILLLTVSCEDAPQDSHGYNFSAVSLCRRTCVVLMRHPYLCLIELVGRLEGLPFRLLELLNAFQEILVVIQRG